LTKILLENSYFSPAQMYAKELTPKFADEKSMLLTRGLKKLSAVQKKLKIENLA
jgi:hypothetical protein